MSASRKGRRPSFTPRNAGSGNPDDAGQNESDARDDDWADIYSGGDAGTEGEVNRTTNVEQAVADGEGREVLHPDGSLTRVGAETVTSLEAGGASTLDDGSRGRVRLATGSLWHEADPDSPAGQTFEVELAAGRIVTRDATFGVMCEPDGSCFVTAVAGEVTVEANQSRPMQLAPLEAVMYSPAGEFLDAIRAEPEELLTDPWIGRNLRLSDLEPGAVRLPAMVAARPAAPAPTPTPAEAPSGESESESGGAAAAAVAAGAAAAVAGLAGETAAAGTDTSAAPPVDETEAEAGTEVLDSETAAAAGFGAGAVGAAAFGAATEEAEADTGADAPEVVVPTAVIAGTAVATGDEYDEYDEGEPPGKARTIVALFLILAGAVLVLIVVLSWIGRSSKNTVDTASSSSTTVTTTKPGGATTVPTTTGPTTSQAPGTTAKPGATGTTVAPATTIPPTTAPPTTTATGNRYTVHPTRCSQTGNQLTAEGNVTDLDTVPHSYKIEVVFTTDNGNTVATTATATVQHAQPNVATSWSTTTTYAPDLAKTGGGCRIGNVTILD